MSQEHTLPATTQSATNLHAGRKGHHRLMMIACCIPMLAIAVALVVAGVVSAGFLVFAVVCTLMMAMMMGGMHGASKQ